MKVSIIIPTYNRSQFLGQSIDSALSQDYENLEVVIADNASTDETRDLLSTYSQNPKVRVRINKENTGMVNNWRDAIENVATGDWFLILSDDDYLIDERYISRAVELILSSLDVLLVLANGYLLGDSIGKLRPLVMPYKSVEPGVQVFLNRGSLRPQDFTLCNVLFKRDIAIKQKAFENSSNLSCDSELFLKLCLLGNVGVIHEFASVYRVHESNLIKSVRLDYSRLMSSLESFSKSYSLAVELLREGKLDCTQADLESWRSKNMVGAARYILYHTIRFHPGKYRNSCQVVDGYSSGLTQLALRSPIFKTKLALAAIYVYFRRLLF